MQETEPVSKVKTSLKHGRQGSFAYAEAELKFMHLSSHVPPSETAPQTFLATRGSDIRS